MSFKNEETRLKYLSLIVVKFFRDNICKQLKNSTKTRAGPGTDVLVPRTAVSSNILLKGITLRIEGQWKIIEIDFC